MRPVILLAFALSFPKPNHFFNEAASHKRTRTNVEKHNKDFLIKNAMPRRLRKSIQAHAEHDYRMDAKFLAMYYHQGKLPTNFLHAKPKDVQEFLAQLSHMNPAFLYYAFNEKNERFCAWLMMHNGGLVSEATDIKRDRFMSLIPRLHQALGIYDRNKRLPIKRNVKRLESHQQSMESLEEMINELSHLLFPPSIAYALKYQGINTLIVVPIKSFGTIPFAGFNIFGAPMLWSE